MSVQRSSSRGRWSRPSLEALEDRVTPADILSVFTQITQVHGLLAAVQANLPALESNPQVAQALPGIEAALVQFAQDDLVQLQAFVQQVEGLFVNDLQAVLTSANLAPAQIAAAEGALAQFFTQVNTFLAGVASQALTNFVQAAQLQQATAPAGTGGGRPFVGNVAGSVRDSFGATNNLSGTVRFSITGTGSLLDPFGGAMTVQGQDTVVIPGFPTSTMMESGSAALRSNLHQILADGSGPGFSFSFNGFVGASEENVVGTLTINLPDGSSDMLGVVAT
jgi:hypothetical protein